MYKVIINRLCSWKQINITVSVVTICLFFSCAVMAQVNAPAWIDSDARSTQYPHKTYYIGFAEIPTTQGEGQEKALSRAKQLAIDELSGSVRVLVSSNKTLLKESFSGSGIEEQIRSKFFSEVKTASQIEVVGCKVDSYYDNKSGRVFAFAYVSKAELASYYQKQISLWLNKVEWALQTAEELAQKGYKMKARKQCESVIDVFGKVFYAQDLLTATDKLADDSTLQQSRSERLRNTLTQTITDLENSTYIYLQYTETANEQPVGDIANRLPGMITEKGCGCNFTDFQDEADYVVKVDAHLIRCNDTPDNMVFCYAIASVNFYNTHTQKTLRLSIAEAKGGWTNRNNARATEEAFKELAEKIAEKVVPMIKN